MGDLAEENARLERQREYFASDDLIRDRAAILREASPEECLEIVVGCCQTAEFFMARKDEATLERLRQFDALPGDTIAILEALQKR